MVNATINASATDATTGREAAIHCHAYNAAFYELGLSWYWDIGTYRHLLADGHDRPHLRSYLETHQPHLLKVYDAEFLADAIQAAKERCYRLAACGPNESLCVDWAEIQKAQVGV